MGRHHHSRSRQTLDTLYYQGYSDGKKGRPKTIDRSKIKRGVWYWHESFYWQGYRAGKRRNKSHWIQYITEQRWLGRTLLIIAAFSFTWGFLSLFATH